MGAEDVQNQDDLIKNELFFLRSIVHRMCDTYNKSELIDLKDRAMMQLNYITSLNVKRINEEMKGQKHDES